ncbi:MAG: hypothetical protein AAF578_07075 [Pseudomonadota bacterium]
MKKRLFEVAAILAILGGWSAVGSATAVADEVEIGQIVEQRGALSTQTFGDCSQPLPFGGERAEIPRSSAKILRLKDGIAAFVRMPTPEPGSYCYPPATLATDPSAGPAVPGAVEAFSLWLIYFNRPDQCLPGGCSARDVLGPNCVNAGAGAIGLGGRATRRARLSLSGYASVGEGPLQGFGCEPLGDTQQAEIHIAIGPHGALREDLLPTQLQVPPGGGPGYWLPKIFLPL